MVRRRHTWPCGPSITAWGAVVAIVCGAACVAKRPPALVPAAKPVSSLFLGILVDTHPEQAPVIEFERHSMDALIDGLGGAVAEGFVTSYSDRVQKVVGWSHLDAGLRQASTAVAVNRSATALGAALYDGIADGLETLMSVGHGRKVLVVIGEGNDGSSTAGVTQTLRTAKREHIQCFVLLVATHRSQVGRVRQYGFDLLRLADATDGRLYDIRTDQRLLERAVRDVRRRALLPQS